MGSETRQREANIKVRALPEEKAAIEERADSYGVSVSQYMRDCALGRPIKKGRIDKAVINELRRQGGSLRERLTQINGAKDKEIALATIEAFKAVLATIQAVAKEGNADADS